MVSKIFLLKHGAHLPSGEAFKEISKKEYLEKRKNGSFDEGDRIIFSNRSFIVETREKKQLVRETPAKPISQKGRQ